MLEYGILNRLENKDKKYFNLKFIEEHLEEMLEQNIENMVDFLKMLEDIDEIEKIFLKKLKYIFRKTESKYIFEVLNYLKKYKIISDYLKKIPNYKVNTTDEDEEIFSILIEKIIDAKHTLKKDKLIDFCKEVFREVFKNEELSILNLRVCGNGRWSNCYNIGSMVIKLGRMRSTDKIPYHPRIIQPLYRKPMAPIDVIRERKDRYDLDELWARKVTRHIEYIEIMPLVETNESITKKKLQGKKTEFEKITQEDLYKVYKELRDDGIVWADPKIENLGRLIGTNEVNYHGITNPSENATGINNEKQKIKKILGPKEIVIIDTDFLFYENDPKLKRIRYRRDIDEGFDRRYNAERNQKDTSR